MLDELRILHAQQSMQRCHRSRFDRHKATGVPSGSYL
ncbi:hypothetical protein FHS91_001098 [Sphingobium xanthum]